MPALANKFDVKWVMSQVGHADSKMSLDVFAQLEQRAQRAHGTSFDRLVRRAREQLYGAPPQGLGGEALRLNCPSRPILARSQISATNTENQPNSREEPGPRCALASAGCSSRIWARRGGLAGYRWRHTPMAGP
ncbi:MAG: hypothetical protein ACRDLN_11585 [Solirubrobacteraceae bacterium]